MNRFFETKGCCIISFNRNNHVHAHHILWICVFCFGHEIGTLQAIDNGLVAIPPRGWTHHVIFPTARSSKTLRWHNTSGAERGVGWHYQKWLYWLVVWLPFFMFPYIGNNHPNWLIFFRGVQTTYLETTGYGATSFLRNNTQMLHVWNIYLHNWAIFGVNVGKYSIHGASGIHFILSLQVRLGMLCSSLMLNNPSIYSAISSGWKHGFLSQTSCRLSEKGTASCSPQRHSGEKRRVDVWPSQQFKIAPSRSDCMVGYERFCSHDGSVYGELFGTQYSRAP